MGLDHDPRLATSATAAASDRGRLPESAFKAPGAPYASWVALAFIGLVVVLMGFDPDARVSLYGGADLGGRASVVSYFVIRARNPADLPGQRARIAQKNGRR